MKTNFIRALKIEKKENAEWIKFGLVYALLFLLMLFTGSGVFGHTTNTRLSLEKFEVKPVSKGIPVFGDFYLEPTQFKGKWDRSLSEIQSLVQARTAHIEKVRLQEHAEKAKLREEHKSLMVNAGNSQDAAKWNKDLYSNITQQVVLKQTSESKIAAWDAKNYLNVKSVKINGKKYITSLRVTRVKSEEKAVATIP